MLVALTLTSMLLAGSNLPPAQEAAALPSPEVERVIEELAKQGVQLDPVLGLASIGATVGVRDDLLEYLLVGPAGASHESVFQTDVMPSVLNVALLALGAERGQNATWRPKDPPVSDAEIADGVSPYEVMPPEGDGFYLYVGWLEEGQAYFFQMEDLLRNLLSGRAMRRHRWVYLGSRMVTDDRGQEVFAADVYQNVINVSFFSEGYTLLTGALPECLEQTIWMANGWLVPQRGSPVRLVFSRTPLEGVPAGLRELLPDAGPQNGER